MPRSFWRVYPPIAFTCAALCQDNSVLVLEAGSPKFNARDIKMPIAILRCALEHTENTP